MLGHILQTDPVGYEDDLNLYAYVGNDPLNRLDPSGKQSADQTRDRLRREINSEIRESSDSTQRVSVLRQAQENLSEANMDQVIGAPDPKAAAELVAAIEDAPAERLYAAVPDSASESGFAAVPAHTMSSLSAGRGAAVDGMVVTGHRHGGWGEADDYAGIGDPIVVLQTGLPAIYENGGVGGAIGFDGAQFTLNPVESLSLPSFEGAPDWVQDTFRPW